MADDKRSDEPSLFDLPLRGQPGAQSRRDAATPAADPADPEIRPPAEEAPFWEVETEAPARPAEPSTSAPTRLFEDQADAGDWAQRAATPESASSGFGEPRYDDATNDPRSESSVLAEDWEEPPPLPELAQPVPAPWTPRLAASLLDGGMLLVVAAGAILGAYLLGVRWDAADLPALGMFLLVFSFVYSVMPLAFWGRTPGMALARLLSRGADGGPLTFGQTALRWLGGLVTVALAGLPLLLALPGLGGRSLADRLSGSHTWLQPDA